MEAIKNYLNQLGIDLSEPLEREFSQFQRKNLAKGAHFHKEGNICKKIGFLISGKIRHYYNIDGKDMTRWIVLKNNFFTAFTSFVNQKPSLENLECIEDTNMYVTSKEHFDSIRKKHPAINNLWINALEQEMAGYEYRVYQLITNDAEKRYLDFIENYPSLIQEVPQKYLASMLGIEPRHLSRIRKKLSQK